MLLFLCLFILSFIFIIVGAGISVYGDSDGYDEAIGTAIVLLNIGLAVIFGIVGAITMTNCITTEAEIIRTDIWYEETLNEINFYQENSGDLYDIHALNEDIIDFNENVALAQRYDKKIFLRGLAPVYYADYEPLSLATLTSD